MGSSALLNARMGLTSSSALAGREESSDPQCLFPALSKATAAAGVKDAALARSEPDSNGLAAVCRGTGLAPSALSSCEAKKPSVWEVSCEANKAAKPRRFYSLNEASWMEVCLWRKAELFLGA
jgi:hypothetical protein